MGNQIGVIPIFENEYLKSCISSAGSSATDLIFKPSARSSRELRIMLLKEKNVVVLACATKENMKDIKELADLLDSRKIPAIVINGDKSLNLELMKMGYFAVINYVHTGTATEQKMLISQIRMKANDAMRIESMLTQRSKPAPSAASTAPSGGGNNRRELVSPLFRALNRNNNSGEHEIDHSNINTVSFGGRGASGFMKTIENEKSANRGNVSPMQRTAVAAPQPTMSVTNKVVDKLIVIGASTGGTEALIEVMKKLPGDIPPILIVQHMPAGFTKMYANRLDYFCSMHVHEAYDGQTVEYGNAYIAPGENHMRLKKSSDRYYLTCTKGEAKVNGVCPSVDVLFDSVVNVMPKKVIGVILTGMGNDGAAGLLKLKRRGAYTIGQNEDTCVVYGMPKVAFERGAVMVQAPIEEIYKLILDNL